jgi:transcription antitermination factor NusG
MISSADKQEWYVWVVKPGKFDLVKKFIEESIPEVTKVLYPTVTSEKVLKTGKVKKKKTPLYSGYLFLQYKHIPENPSVWVRLKAHPFISNYVGPCTPADLASVDSLQKVETLNLEAVKKFEVGDLVTVNGGVFKSYRGVVVDISANTIRVDVDSGNKRMKIVFSPDDLDILDRKSYLR